MIIIEKNKINDFAQKLAEKNIIFAPIRREGKISESVFEKLEAGKKIDFDYLPTLRSVKEFFIPAKEKTFVLGNKNKKIIFSNTPKNIIIFALNERDLEAIAQLDEIMLRPNKDYFYFKKRENVAIVGIIDENFKTSRIGDLILVKINSKEYQAFPLTAKGKKMIKNKFFKNKAGLIANSGSKSLEIMPRLRRLLADPEILADAVDWSWKNYPQIWDELAEICLGCGICSYVCPLCFCFSTEDRISIDKKECSRCRKWDACTSPRFNQVSVALPDGRQGFNFHKTIKERYYNWFFHKFVRAYKEYGKSQCVACGRCQKYCPAKIDIEKYLLKIIENYKKSK